MDLPLRIPLFPLELVLFPGMALPLHIFEPRYREMTRRCMDEHLEFGVVLARPDGVAAVGCTAEISKVVRTYPDGRSDILATGRHVFQVSEVLDEKPYLEAQVEYWAESPDAGDATARGKLEQLYRQSYALIHGRPTEPPQWEDGVPLSYQILGTLPFDLDYKQEMLETPSESERQEQLLERMPKWIERLSGIDRTRRSAGGNGHGLR